MKSDYINCKNCKDDCRCRGKNITPICVSFKPVKTTNADRIRSMTDEELAHFIAGQRGWYCDFKDQEEEEYPKVLNWLKAPVEEVDNGA